MKRKTMRHMALALLALLLAGCAVPLPANRPYAQVPLNSAQHFQVSVYAAGNWQDSGVTLKGGDRFFLDAQGTWSGGLGWISGPSGAVGPDIGRIMPEEPAATALIGRIGDGAPFSIRDQYFGTAANDGNIFMRMNDPTTFDNSGAVSVDIYVETAPMGSAGTVDIH